MSTYPLANSRVRPIVGFMVPRKNKPPSHPEVFTFERKVLLWLADRSMSMRHLAGMCGFTPSTLFRSSTQGIVDLPAYFGHRRPEDAQTTARKQRKPTEIDRP